MIFSSFAPLDFTQLARLAPVGYCAVLRVRNGRPAHVENHFPQDWQSSYARKSYFLRDPAIGWALSHDGAVDWRDLATSDPHGVIADARAHGLSHGITVATGDRDIRSFCGLARPDRPFTTAERQSALALIDKLHEGPERAVALTAAQREALTLMARGDRHLEAAKRIGITESALKARLKSARVTLGARTTIEAVHAAQKLGMI